MSGKRYVGEQCLPISLKISPMEQIQLLERMYLYKLPVKKRNVDILKKIIVLSKENDATLSGKTGTEQGKIGWFVGYVEKGDDVYFFATNIQSGVNASGVEAKEITLRILKDKKLFLIK
jgi:bla regulator protein BlaR1